jgi:hypothetical protein
MAFYDLKNGIRKAFKKQKKETENKSFRRTDAF